MFSTGVLWIFRLVHILSAVFWVGGVLLFSFFLFPTARALGPAAAPVMNHMTQVLKLPRALLIAGFLTVLSGLGMYWNDSMGFQRAWMSSPTGIVFGVGAASAILAIGIGLSVNAPTAQRMGELGAQIQAKGGPPTPEQAAQMQSLQKRLGGALRVVTLLLLVATAAMALARYVS